MMEAATTQVSEAPTHHAQQHLEADGTAGSKHHWFGHHLRFTSQLQVSTLLRWVADWRFAPQ
jgi:hypothetical protein